MYQHSESAAEEEEEGKSHPSGYWQDSGHRDRELAVYETLQHVCRPYGVSGVCCRAIRSVRLAGSAVVSRPVPLRGRFASLDTATVPAQVAAIGWPGGCDDAGGRGHPASRSQVGVGCRPDHSCCVSFPSGRATFAGGAGCFLSVRRWDWMCTRDRCSRRGGLAGRSAVLAAAGAGQRRRGRLGAAATRTGRGGLRVLHSEILG